MYVFLSLPMSSNRSLICRKSMYSIGRYVRGGRLFDSFTCNVFSATARTAKSKKLYLLEFPKTLIRLRTKDELSYTLQIFTLNIFLTSLKDSETSLVLYFCSLRQKSLLYVYMHTCLCLLFVHVYFAKQYVRYGQLRINNKKCKVNVLIYKNQELKIMYSLPEIYILNNFLL